MKFSLALLSFSAVPSPVDAQDEDFRRLTGLIGRERPSALWQHAAAARLRGGSFCQSRRPAVHHCAVDNRECGIQLSDVYQVLVRNYFILDWSVGVFP